MAPSSWLPILPMGVLFTAMGAFAVARNGRAFVASGSMLHLLGLGCLTFPGPLILAATALLLRVRLDLLDGGVRFQGALRGWSLLWPDVVKIRFHHAPGTLRDAVEPDLAIERWPIGRIEFLTASGVTQAISMGSFRLAVEPEDLADALSRFAQYATGSAGPAVEHVKRGLLTGG